jgi:hypothetical protein
MLLAQRIQQGLSRKAVTEASRWACKYRYMGHPYPGLWTFDHHPWLKDMHDSKASLNVGQKAAQCGYTEWALNKSCFFIDVKRMDVLYVLPNTRPDAADFSSSRFDKALELSEHLKALFSNVQNVGHKRAGSANLFIRGSNSRSGLMSIPVSLLVLDELDEMEQENIPIAMERLSGQIERHQLMLSTPTIPDFGINYYFNDTTKEHFFFPCPSCSRQIELSYPDNIVICGSDASDPDTKLSHLICNYCKAVLPHEGKHEYIGKGEWVSENPGRDARGFYINQLYAMHLHPQVFAKAYLNSLRDPTAEQALFNAKLGLPHIVAGARIIDEHIHQCIGQYRKLDFNRQGIVTMGVDVGRKLHVEIDQWEVDARSGYDLNSYARPRVLTHLEVDHFEQLDELMMDFAVHFCIIDSQPERRKALEFANRFPGRIKLCRYPVGVNGRNITISSEEEMIINVDRTSWLDLALGRFKNNTITLPMDTSVDYKEQIKAQVRIPKKDANGNPISRYETPGNRHDHYGHARNYAEIALPFALGLGVASDIRG